MPVPAPNFNQFPWSIEPPTEPGNYLLRRGDMLTDVEVLEDGGRLTVVFSGSGESSFIEDVAGPTTEWQPID